MKQVLRVVGLLCAVAIMVGCFAACGGSGEKKEDEAALTKVRESLIKEKEIAGLGNIDKMEFYENGVRTESEEYVQVKDNKKIYWSGDIKRVVNYADGYWMDIPTDWKPDYSMSTLRVRYETDAVTLVASEESNAYSAYGSYEKFHDTIYSYITAATYMKANKVEKLSEETVALEGKYQANILKMHVLDTDETTKSYYTYVNIYDGVKHLYWLMFKSVDDRDFADIYKTFHAFTSKGSPVDTITYPESANPNWSAETKTYYEEMKQSTKIDWGIFCPKLQTTGWNNTIPNIEKKIDYKFPVISQYVHLGGDFPVDFANEVNADGRMLQMSYQFTTSNNLELDKYTPVIDIYRGVKDEVLRSFAQQIVQYGKPIFFRLNNEMNTDWTSYCGMASMCDPDIFVENWERLYNIFTEEGANQYCMWIFNGFDGSFPPLKCMNYRCYMPDASYIDMIGLTGYDNGQQSFEKVYDNINNMYKPLFGDWAWIVSEFGCAAAKDSIDGYKEQWIKDMGDALATKKYPNIKVAIWFSASDYDDAGVVTKKFNLDESAAILNAFGKAVQQSQ